MRSADNQALQTDLYELAMAAAYLKKGMHAQATFELFARSLPANRGYLLTAGLQQALDYLETLSFSPEQIGFLRQHPTFAHVDASFFDYLAQLRFSGEVWAMAEGTPVFPLEPVLRVTAPIIEAQIVETFLISTITFQTLIATKASRIVQSADGRQVLEFGSRRAHGPEAGVLAARAAYIGGCHGSSNVEADFQFGVPSFGTLAHSFIMAYDNEEQSLRDFQAVFPEHAILLLDTYDTLAALEKIINAGLRPRGVRLDSGDFVELSRETRRRLDEAGLNDTKIFASGDLDEESIAGLLAAGAAIDAFGVGTTLSTSADAPALSSVYKLVEFDGRPRVKLSTHKPSYPGRKQVFRSLQDELWVGDVIGLDDEELPGERLLECVMRDGRRLTPSPPLDEVRARARTTLQCLPSAVRDFTSPATYAVRASKRLDELWESTRRIAHPDRQE